MRALYITEPGGSELRDIEPPHPKPNEVLLKTRLIGFCGTDLSTYRGKNPLVSYPRIPGHEIAATVVDLGAEVPNDIRTGAEVTVYPNTCCGKCASCRRGRPNACKFNQTLGNQRDGALTDYFCVPWDKVYRAPDLSLCELALVEPLSVGFHAVERGRVTEHDIVAVIGCGMVGLGAIASSSSRGANVIAVDVDESKLQLARKAGAGAAVNSRAGNVEQTLQGMTDGFGPDVVIEAVGVPDTYRLAVELVAHTGRVVYIGWAKDPVTFDTKNFVHKELDILGSRNYLNEFPTVIDLLCQKRFPVNETISRVVPMSEAGDALRAWCDAPQAFTKILVDLEA
ncbi:MAG TPA: zinc-binding alcohol dehydrogenase family protein [Bryobacteraceae bacterium]|nr:zinc-binding alcohol dehydrogenase family protein [Bryobacteraceae bacterium]